MFEQIFDNVRKASESSVQLQQEMLKQWTQNWMAIPGGASGGATDWGRGFQKRWADLTLELLNKHRESLDAMYTSAISIIEQSFRVSEARSADDYRRLVEDLSRKLFELFKEQSEAQFRDFQKWSAKSAEIVQDARS
jgi:hypothetical protein